MTCSASCHSLAAVQKANSGRDDDENQSVSQSVKSFKKLFIPSKENVDATHKEQ